MLALLITLTLVLGLAMLIGRTTTGSTGVIDRDAQRVGAELSAIADYTHSIRTDRP
ncbi:hypothetical protein ACFO5K_09450 [Nocardia halotolerans]|uniref:Two-component sensor histidine kinase n=1 Tax=Nocardia halotolerans TaxID=1755878 RepID=A0ABV8VHR2_9NOCA